MPASFPWRCLALVAVLLPAAAARADIAADVHRLLIAERFDAAEARASAALVAVRGDAAPAQRQRLQALDLLIESAGARHGIKQAGTLEWIHQAQAAAARLYAPDDRRRAKWLLLEALNAFGQADAAQRERSAALAGEAAALLDHGAGRLDRFDESVIHDGLSTAALMTRKYDAGLLEAQRAEALMRRPRTPWERRWRSQLLASLGLMQSLNGQGAAALESARAGVELAAEVCGRDSLLYADNISRLGQVQMYAGDYAGVRDSLQRAVELYRQRPWLGIHAADRAANSLANAYRRLGDYAHARTLFEQVIANNEVDAQGHFDEMLPDGLDTLAGLENEVGNTERARQLYERALQLEDQLYGTTHPLFLEKPLINLGDVALQQQDLAAAEKYLTRAAALDATDRSGALTNFLRQSQADLALAQGDAAQAETLLAASIDDTTRRFGAQHRWLVPRYCELAIARARLGKDDAAFDTAEAGERLRIDLLRRIAPALGEEHALNFKKQMGSCSGLMLALAARRGDPARTLRAWQLVADSRGLTTRLQAARIAAARSAADAAGKERWSRWDKAARKYADALLRNAPSRTELDAAHDALDAAESDLGTAALAAAGLAATTHVDALLARDHETVVVAYAVVRHPLIDAQARGQRHAGHDLYALVSRGTARRLVPLGDADAVDADVSAWLKLLRNPAADPAVLAVAGRAVRAEVWDPLAIATTGRQVHMVPDGPLFRVNFAALPDRDGFLVERGWRFHLLDSEHDLDLAADAPTAHRLLVLGAPDFGTPPSGAHAARACAGGFAPLPGAADEARGLASLWQQERGGTATVLLARDASKPALQAAARGASVLHFATHAFETGAECDAANVARGVSLEPRAMTPGASGAALALAGANRYFTDGATDGLLTSVEAATLPLEHARWVVLAACDTGLGEVIADEGVFGLRRGFRLAGARTVLMSLWPVDDAATNGFMQALYKARWQDHVDTPEALARAELATLAARRQQGASAHPYYWAAFVASGDWR